MTKKNEKNKKIKYDWSSLKIEFFESDFIDIKGFFIDKGVIYNSYIARNTVGWAKEKKIMLAKIPQEVKDKCFKESKEKWENLFSNIDKVRFNGLNQLVNNVQDGIGDMDNNELIKVLSFLRLESGEDKTPAQSNNSNSILRERLILLKEVKQKNGNTKRRRNKKTG